MKSLNLDGIKITGTGFGQLRGFDQVERLSLSRSTIQDDELAHLTCFPRLRHLILDRTSVSDVGLANLRGLPMLEWLNINKTNVSAEGLKHLKELPSLRRVMISDDGKITDQQIESLKKFMPKILVYSSIFAHMH